MAIDRKAEIAANLANIKSQIPESVHLIVVTKTFPISDVEILRELGCSEFGENRDQEGKLKAPAVSAKWHFQGQLQSNKLRSICSWADVIQTVDSLRYVDLISRALTRISEEGNFGKDSLEIFIQVSLDSELDSRIDSRLDSIESARQGADPREINQIADAILATKNLKLQGLMAVAPLGEAPDSAFLRLSKIHSDFKANYPNSPYLSAGMSGDFQSAISHGATHVRIGSQILGSRN